MLAVAAVLLLPGTFGVSLFDRDEGWHAQVSREMLETGDWLVPRYLGEVWLIKPPLLYWLTLLSWRAFGVGEGQARLVSVAAMCLNTVLVSRLGAHMFGRRAGIVAGVVFITTALPLVVGKLLLTDPLMLAAVLLAVLMHWRMAVDRITHRRASLYWLAIGLGILAKGPTVLVFAGAFGLALLRVRPYRGWIFDGRWWAWAPLGAAVALPWYVFAHRAAGNALADQFLWFELVLRAVRPDHGHGGPPGYYLVVGLVCLLPWTAFVPGTLAAAFRERRSDPKVRVLLLWLGISWLVLELLRSKLPHYGLACCVPIAILLGRMWDGATARSAEAAVPTRAERFVLDLWWQVPVVLGITIVGIAACFLRADWAVPAAACGAALAVGFVIAGRQVRLRRPRAALAAAVAGIGLFYVGVGLRLLPKIEPHRLSRLVAEQANALAPSGAPTTLCGYEEPSVAFYVRGSVREALPEQLRALLAAAGGPRILIARDSDWRAAGVRPGAPNAVWRHVAGFNYVKGKRESVWIALTRHGET